MVATLLNSGFLAIFRLAFLAFLTHTYVAEEASYFVFSLVIFDLLLTIFFLGSNTTIYSSPEHYEKNELKNLLYSRAILSLLVCCVAYLLYEEVSGWVLAVPAMLLYEGFTIEYERQLRFYDVLCRTIARIGLFFGLFFVLYGSYGNPPSITIALLIYFLSCLPVVVYDLFANKWKLKISTLSAQRKTIFLSRYAITNQIIIFILRRGDVFLMAALLSVKDAALFAVAQNFAYVVPLITGPVVKYSLPMLAADAFSENVKRLMNAPLTLGIYASLVALALSVVSFLVMQLSIGQDLKPEFVICAFVMGGVSINAGAALITVSHTVNDRLQQLNRVSFEQLLLQCLISPLLLWNFGLLGAATSFFTIRAYGIARLVRL